MDTGLDLVKTSSKKVVHKPSEFTGNKITNAVTNYSNDNNEKQEPLEETIIPLGNWEEIFKKLRKVLQECNTMKYLSC